MDDIVTDRLIIKRCGHGRIFLKENKKEEIGFISSYDATQYGAQAQEICYKLESHRGCGYMTEALSAKTKQIIQDYNRVPVLEIDETNKDSINVAKRVKYFEYTDAKLVKSDKEYKVKVYVPKGIASDVETKQLIIQDKDLEL